MFIERSSSRIRLARTLFIVLGLLPCACLCGWAAVRHSRGHREAIERRFGLVLGIPVRIGRVEHVRPDALRLRDCVVVPPEAAAELRFPVVDLEWSASELRVRVGRFDGDAAAIRAIAGLARDWLRQPARFPLDCVVDVGECAWRGRPLRAGASSSSAMPSAVRVECVAAHGSRAVRVRRNAGADADELRAVATASGGETTLEVTGRITGPLPLSLALAAAGIDGRAIAVGEEACVSGELDAVVERGQSRGQARGIVDGIDLAAATAELPHRTGGVASVKIERLVWDRGRIGGFEAACSVARGRVSQRLLDTLVTTLGCRPGPAYRALDREDSRVFDDVEARVRIDGHGLDLRSAPGRDGSLARVQGMSIIGEPGRIVPLDRLAWAIAPASAPAVPATAASTWLMDVFSDGGAADAAPVERGGPAGRALPEQAGRPQSRSGF